MERREQGSADSPPSGRFRHCPNVVIAIGNRIPLNGFDRWLGELDRITNHVNVHWIHLKFMLVDPLSDEPDRRDGLGQFQRRQHYDERREHAGDQGQHARRRHLSSVNTSRLYSHYAFREAVQIFLDKNPDAKPEDMKLGFLIDKGDWTAPYLDPKDGAADGRDASTSRACDEARDQDLMPNLIGGLGERGGGEGGGEWGGGGGGRGGGGGGGGGWRGWGVVDGGVVGGAGKARCFFIISTSD